MAVNLHTANSLRVHGREEWHLPFHASGGPLFMDMARTVGAAIGAAVVLLFLATVASRLTWTPL